MIKGIQLVVYCLSCRLLFKSESNTARQGANFYVIYGGVLVVLWTIALACNAVFGQKSWIDHRDVEGGPAAYIGENISDVYNTVGTTAGVMLNFLGDGLLVRFQ